MRALALGLVVAASVACGVKKAPLPPELVRPSPPTNLVAATVPEGVKLTWRRPTRYTGGGQMQDLLGFEVERSVDDGQGVYTRVGAIRLDDRQRFRKETRIDWIDERVTAGTAYLYRVKSITLDGSTSDATGAVAIRYEPAAKSTAKHAK